jgi:hypothetical protein
MRGIYKNLESSSSGIEVEERMECSLKTKKTGALFVIFV